MQFFTTVLSALALAASTTTASPIVARHDSSSYCFVPKITYPVGGVIWNSGSIQTIMWDTSVIPANASGLTAALFLGNDGTGSEYIYLTPLSAGFYLDSGFSTINVPSVQNSTSYFVILSIGPSDYAINISQPENRSPCFTILGPW